MASDPAPAAWLAETVRDMLAAAQEQGLKRDEVELRLHPIVFDLVAAGRSSWLECQGVPVLPDRRLQFGMVTMVRRPELPPVSLSLAAEAGSASPPAGEELVDRAGALELARMWRRAPGERWPGS